LLAVAAAVLGVAVKRLLLLQAAAAAARPSAQNSENISMFK
jgi:hypothetical protein